MARLTADTPIRSLPFKLWIDEPFTEMDTRRAMPGPIPSKTVYTIEEGDEGMGAWAVQRALNSVMGAGLGLVEDGSYGEATKSAVRQFQGRREIFKDGVFGPGTSEEMAMACEARIRKNKPQLPQGILRGLVHGESGSLIAAVNWTVAGGVDCGYTQRRVYDEDFFDEAVVKRAFDSRWQIGLLGGNLITTHDRFLGRPGARTNELAWRGSLQYHNYPYGATKVADVGLNNLTGYWVAAQSWVVNIGANFEDGADVRTPKEWMQFYAYGAPEHDHEGLMARSVTDWTP